MKFSSEFIEKVRDANNIVDIIAQHTQLKPMSGGFMGRCPFPDHQEKTASFSVSEVKQVYNCFGCHKKGNIFTFIQQFMGLSFPEAVEYLADRANISIPVFSESENEKQDLILKKKKEILYLNKLTNQFYYEQFQRLPRTHPAKIYAIDKRGLKEKTLQEFQIGYAPEEWDSLTRYLDSKGVSLSLAEEAKLIKSRKEGTGYFDIFRDRLMFPITNQLNETVGFGGRIIQQGEPKYLNSGETPVFNKGKILYGLAQTAKFIRSEDQVIIVEGYMDLVSLFQEGIQNAAATMGTALTYEHGRTLHRMTQNVVVLFDGDEAGQMAAERSLPILLSSEVHPKGFILPEGQDPDDYVKKYGSESLKNLISKSSDLFSMVLHLWLQNFRGEASDKVKMSDKLKPIFESMQDIRLKRLYFDEVLQKMSVDASWLKQALQVATQNMPLKRKEDLGPKVPPLSKTSTSTEILEDPDQIVLKGASKPELVLMAYALKNTSNFNKIENEKVLSLIQSKGVHAVLEKAALTSRQDPEKFDKLAGLLTSFVDLPELLFVAETKEGGDDDFVNQEREARLLNDCIKRIQENALKAQAEKLALEIKKEPSPEKLEQFMNIQRDRMALQKDQ